MVEGKKSTFRIVISGVPQGTVIGPILFILYINDLIEVLKHSKGLSFADDTKLVWQHELWSDAPFLKAVSVALIIARQRHPGNFTQRFILSGLAQMKERH